MAPPKIRYEIDLAVAGAGEASAPVGVHPLTPADRDRLAALMLDAYAGTIDSEDESLADAEAEVDQWLADAPVLDHSHGAVVDGELVAAVLVMELDGQPFVAIVMTAAANKRAGWGRAVVQAAVSGLRSEGHERVALFITEGNVASERLFAGFGAVPIAR